MAKDTTTQKPLEEKSSTVDKIVDEKKAASGDEVKVERNVLEQILAAQKEQANIIEDLKTENKRLNTLVSMNKRDVARYDEKNPGELIKHVNVRMWNGSIVLGWKKGKDEVGVVNGVLIEKQTVVLFLENGKEAPKELEVEYLNWARNCSYEEVEVTKESRERSTGAEIYTVLFADGREFDFDIRFLN